MKSTIRADHHFELTPAIKAHVAQSLEKIVALLPDDAIVHVLLSEPAPGVFDATMRVRLAGKDVVASDTNNNLYTAINRAKALLFKLISASRHKRVALRRTDQILNHVF